MTISKQHYHYLDFRVAFFLFFFFFPLFIFYFYFYFWEDIVIIIIHWAVHLGLLSRRVPRDSRDMGLKRFEKEKVVSTAFPLWKMVHSISMWGEPTGFIILGFYQQCPLRIETQYIHSTQWTVVSPLKLPLFLFI